MRPASWVLPALCLVFSSATLGCNLSSRQPRAVSSAGDGSYAHDYPAQLEATVKKYEAHQGDIKQAAGHMPGFPDQLKDVKKDRALLIYTRADEAGRSQGYVERAREADQVSAFFEQEKDELNKKIGGSVAFAAKQKGCSADVYGVTSHALSEAVTKQIEKRMHDRNEAHEVIERYRTELGKANVAALEKQVDEVSAASFYLYIEAPELREQARSMAGEGDQIKRTADDYIAREKAFQGEPGRTAEDKKASEERAAAMGRSKAAVDAAVQRARQALEAAAQREQDARREYEDALARLKEKLKK